MTIASLQEPGNGMTTTWAILAVEWVVFMVLALYLEQVIPPVIFHNSFHSSHGLGQQPAPSF